MSLRKGGTINQTIRVTQGRTTLTYLIDRWD